MHTFLKKDKNKLLIQNQTILYPPIKYTGKKTLAYKRMLKPIAITLSAFLLATGGAFVGATIVSNHILNDLQSNLLIAQTQAQIQSQSVIEQLNAHIAEIPQPPLTSLFNYANPAVVAISTESSGRNVFGQIVNRPSAGSGFIVSSEGYIVTNDHVIENTTSITVIMYDGREMPAVIVGRAPFSDLAVIKVEGSGFPYLTFGDSNTLQVGLQVAAIGNPLGEFANSMTVGHISALDRSINIDGLSQNKIQTDTAVNRGNSGGPLLNIHGQVIGVVSAKSTGTGIEGIGFAIPSTYAKGVVSDLINYGYVRGRAILGISVNDSTGYVVVHSVGIGTAAYVAGIREGDIIIEINNTSLQTFIELRSHLDDASPNDIMHITLMRGDEEISLTAVLDEYRPMS